MINYKSTSEFTEVVFSCRLAFSKSSWPYMLSTAIPWLVLSGQRSVRRLASGEMLKRHESSFYRFFSSYKFRPEVFFKALLMLVMETFKLKELTLAVDDTLCPKWGKKIFGAAYLFDHVKRPRPGTIWGHNWVVIAVVINTHGVFMSLPIWISLYRPKSICKKSEFKTRLQLTNEAVEKIKQWAKCPILLLADGAYNNKTLITPLKKMDITLVSRLRSDAVLKYDPPKQKKKKRGRPSHYGRKLPSLPNMAKNENGWTRMMVIIYGNFVELDVKSFQAWWPKSKVKLNIVITRDPTEKRPVCYLSSTDLSMEPHEIIELFSQRWSIEQLFADVKQSIGLDTAEVRTKNSVLRHAYFSFALVTWTRVWAFKKYKNSESSPNSYPKQLAALKTDILTETILSSIPKKLLPIKKSRQLAALLAA